MNRPAGQPGAAGTVVIATFLALMLAYAASRFIALTRESVPAGWLLLGAPALPVTFALAPIFERLSVFARRLLYVPACTVMALALPDRLTSVRRFDGPTQMAGLGAIFAAYPCLLIVLLRIRQRRRADYQLDDASQRRAEAIRAGRE